MILPKNEIKKTINEPRNFFIYGEPMSGKSFLAGHFDNPIFLNTDSNALQNPYPNIQLKNIKDRNGNLQKSVINDLVDFIDELREYNNGNEFGYKTVVVDVIDDVCQLIEQAICVANHKQSLADFGYGKGFALFNSTLNNFVLDLKGLNVNVVYISRENVEVDEKTNAKKVTPSLKPKYMNIVDGNCDLLIHTRKIGQYYKRNVESIRKQYYAEDIKNPKMLELLKYIPGALKTKNKK